jgi:nucleoside-diphosphate-sugar epimerase
MKAFVTGATGLVGSHLVELLACRGDEVTCLVRDRRRAVVLPPVRMVIGDLADDRALHTAAAGADVVFHVAGRTGAMRPATLDRVNRDGTARVLAAVARAAPRSRFIYIGSLAAGGPSHRGRPRLETDPDAPVSAYGRSKLAAEALVRSESLPFTVVRPPSVYGPRDQTFLPLFRLARTGRIPMPGDLTQELSYIYAPDLAAAIVAATAPQCVGRTYYVANPEITTGAEFAETIHAAICQVMGTGARRPPRLLRIPHTIAAVAVTASGAIAALRGRATPLTPDKLPELRATAWTCSPAALTGDTGWTAKTSLVQGTIETARWYGQHGRI